MPPTPFPPALFNLFSFMVLQPFGPIEPSVCGCVFVGVLGVWGGGGGLPHPDCRLRIPDFTEAGYRACTPSSRPGTPGRRLEVRARGYILSLLYNNTRLQGRAG